MGRLPAVTRALGRGLVCLSLGAWILACKNQDTKPTSAPRERSQAIAGVPTVAEEQPEKAPEKAPASAEPTRRSLCPHASKSDKELPKKPLSREASSGSPSLPEDLGHRASVTWINFWAAWCAPCKEEIPRLLRWQKELGPALDVVFISLDDDTRQLHRFLSMPGGLTETYWLREGSERTDWMSGAGLPTDPELPLHLLVHRDGSIFCKVQGAVEDSDYPELSRIVGG